LTTSYFLTLDSFSVFRDLEWIFSPVFRKASRFNASFLRELLPRGLLNRSVTQVLASRPESSTPIGPQILPKGFLLQSWVSFVFLVFF